MVGGIAQLKLLDDSADVSHLLLGKLLLLIVAAHISGEGTRDESGSNEVAVGFAVFSWFLRKFIWRIFKRLSFAAVWLEDRSPFCWSGGTGAEWSVHDGYCVHGGPDPLNYAVGPWLRCDGLHAACVVGNLP